MIPRENPNIFLKLINSVFEIDVHNYRKASRFIMFVKELSR